MPAFFWNNRTESLWPAVMPSTLPFTRTAFVFMSRMSVPLASVPATTVTGAAPFASGEFG